MVAWRKMLAGLLGSVKSVRTKIEDDDPQVVEGEKN